MGGDGCDSAPCDRVIYGNLLIMNVVVISTPARLFNLRKNGLDMLIKYK